jgi:enoyl-CoA hydratase/carnithine racemase
MSDWTEQHLETLVVKRSGARTIIELNRPKVRNAMSLAMCHDIVHAFGDLRFDTQTKVVLVRGAGPVFCSGIDLSEFEGKSEQWVLERRNFGLDAFAAIDACPAPVVAAIQGAAIGAGGEIAAAADFCIATSEAVFRWPEVVWGTVGATQRLQRLVGLPLAKDLLFTGRSLSAQEAQQAGFVTRVVESHDLDVACQTVLDQLDGGFGLAARLVKKSMTLGRDLPLGLGVEVERQLLARSLLDTEWQRGLAEFARRRRG